MGILQVQDTKFEKAKLIIPHVQYDYRGYYKETYSKGDYEAIGAPSMFVQDDISMSYKNVLRGFHGDFVTWKLIQCLYGAIQAVIIDLNKDSSTFGQSQSFCLNDTNHYQLLLPPGFGNSSLALTDKILYSYKQSTYYSGKQFTLYYKAAREVWATNNPILSYRDADQAADSVDLLVFWLSTDTELENNPYLNISES